MGLFDGLFGGGGKKKRYRWKPLLCHTGDVIDLMRELERIDAPTLDLDFEYQGEMYQCGMSSDYEEERGFFDTLWYLDGQEFTSLDAFLDGAMIDGVRFSELDAPIALLKEWETGDPRGYTLLAERELFVEELPFS